MLGTGRSRVQSQRRQRGGATEWGTGTWARDSENGRFILEGLGHGGPAAKRFPGDLAALESLAEGRPAVTPVPADSREAVELAVRIAHTNLVNAGCASTGGVLATKLEPVTFASADRRTGEVGGIAFAATFDPEGGWAVQLLAC